MTALDMIVLLMMGTGAVFGFLRGFVQEILSLLLWLFVILGVRFLHAPVTLFLEGPIGNGGGAAILAFAAIVILSVAVGRWIVKSIGKKSRKSILGPVDRVLGFGFGLLKGLVIATLLFLLFSLVYNSVFGEEADRPLWMSDSRTYPLLSASGEAMSGLVNRQTGRASPQEEDALDAAAPEETQEGEN